MFLRNLQRDIKIDGILILLRYVTGLLINGLIQLESESYGREGYLIGAFENVYISIL